MNVMNTFQGDLKNRTEIYRFLANLYREELKEETAVKLFKSGAWEDFREAGYFAVTKAGDGNSKQWTDELAVEFTRLFLGPGPHLPPVGSVHFQPDQGGGRYWGEITVAIRNFIGHHGLEFDENFKGFPDHLSILFDFMTLILEKRQALEKGSRREDLAHCLKIEQAFFGQYIASWVPAYAEKVIKEARLDFYRDLARLTRDFVEFEMAASGVSSPT